jgi:hypothetical protein
MAVVKTYSGAVKAVGEKVILNYAKSNVAADVDDDFDFLLDNCYYVTGMSITKTSASMTQTQDTSRLFATVLRVKSTGVVAATDVIAQAGFYAKDTIAGLAAIQNGVKGQKAVAGLPGSQTNAAAAAECPVFVGLPAETGFSNTTWLDPRVTLLSNAQIAGTTNSKQRMRIKVTSESAGDSSCFIVVYLAKYLPTAQGAATNSNQLEEVLSPVL